MSQTILLVEDHEDDVLLIKRALKKFSSATNVQVAQDGIAAMEYLSGVNKYCDRMLYPLPSLVLMDIKMPRANGLEVLEWMRHRDGIKMIPVVIISASQIEKDINKAYELGVNAYFDKPVQFLELQTIFQLVTNFFIKQIAHPVHKGMSKSAEQVRSIGRKLTF